MDSSKMELLWEGSENIDWRPTGKSYSIEGCKQIAEGCKSFLNRLYKYLSLVPSPQVGDRASVE